jgi:hypothetical protein
MMVVATGLLLKDARRMMPHWGQMRLVEFMGANRQTGYLTPGTAGVRKLPWAYPAEASKEAGLPIHCFTAGWAFLQTAVSVQRHRRVLSAESEKRWIRSVR